MPIPRPGTMRCAASATACSKASGWSTSCCCCSRRKPAPPSRVVTAAILGSASGVTLRVADNEPGIPADQRERVFERFYRLHDDGPGGSGLGLPIVREIAAASHADVKLSDPPSGNGLIVSVN